MADFKWNEKKKIYEIAEVGLVDIAKRKLDEYDLRNVVIDSDETYKIVWSARTQINNMIGDLSKSRKQMEAITLSYFKPYCMEVEKYGSMISDELTKKLNAYKPKEKKKPTTFSITIKTEELKVIKKLEQMALKYGCQIITKEE